ncbi:MAG: hypothetical protein IJT53_09010 [Prevotella sp.]|nr:hypothetical protein [Prevotella sp.]
MKKNILWMLAAILTSGIVLTSCSSDDEPVAAPTPADEVEAQLQQMTLREKVGVGTLLAGVDIVLGPQNFVEAFDAVVKAVEDGTLSQQRIDESVRRVLKLKKQIGRDM